MTDQQVAAGLRSLRTSAPEGLMSKVLDRLGLGDAYVRVEGPIGPLFVAFGRGGISLVERADRSDAGDFEAAFRATFGRPVRRIDRAPELIERVIDQRLWGKGGVTRTSGPLPLDLHELPDFEQQVLRKVLEIPRGEVRPYAWVAAELGRPLAVRAVGNAVARNPIPFVIPCHRVVAADGRLTGYSGGNGIATKQALLELEARFGSGVRPLPGLQTAQS